MINQKITKKKKKVLFDFLLTIIKAEDPSLMKMSRVGMLNSRAKKENVGQNEG